MYSVYQNTDIQLYIMAIFAYMGNKILAIISPVYTRPLIRIRIQIRYNEGLANPGSNPD